MAAPWPVAGIIQALWHDHVFHLPRVVGVQRAKQLLLSARDVDAQEAMRLARP